MMISNVWLVVASFVTIVLVFCSGSASVACAPVSSLASMGRQKPHSLTREFTLKGV